MVDLSQRVHFLLFLPCRAGLKQTFSGFELNATETYLARLQKLNVITPDLTTVLILPNMIQRKLVRDSDVIALRWCDVEAAKIDTEPQITDAREI